MVLAPLSTIVQLYRGCQFYWRRKPEYPEKTSVLSQLTETLSHNVLSSIPHHERDSNTQLLVVKDTDCIGSCKSNYHAITTTAEPPGVKVAASILCKFIFTKTTHSIKAKICGIKCSWHEISISI